ncbi:MAG: outer membrane protein assembly factor BamE [Cellvibrionaceae bacterium]
MRNSCSKRKILINQNRRHTHKNLKKFIGIPVILLGLMAINGCSWLQFPGVYRLNIQQGNIVTQEMVDQLKPGMTKRQVNFVLGTALIQDSFEQDRWDYYYSLRDSDGKTTKEKFTVYFEDDKLTHFSGDYQPTPPPQSAVKTTETKDTAATEEE